eukprot:7773818-Pyramimonas_sp.AAC.1
MRFWRRGWRRWEFGANRSKQVSLFHVSGVGGIKVKLWLRHHAVPILGGELHESTRYLGPCVSLSGTTGAAVARRKEAASSGFYSMG